MDKKQSKEIKEAEKKRILKDPIYKSFFFALDFIINRQERRLKQSELVNKIKDSKRHKDVKISKPHMSDFVNGYKKAKYEQRFAIADVCGYSYEDFLSFGKDLCNKSDSDNNNLIIIKHKGIVPKFKYKNEGYAANQALLKIEELDRDAFFVEVAKLKALSIKLEERKNEDIERGAMNSLTTEDMEAVRKDGTDQG